MLFDTDVLIWYFRGKETAAQLINEVDKRSISAVTSMELIQGARDKTELRQIRSFLADFDIRTLPLTENIGHRATIYLETFALSDGLAMADALIAATASEHALSLVTGNAKHFKCISEIDLKSYRP
jgi:predicted nucleic acid-binding protein